MTLFDEFGDTGVIQSELADGRGGLSENGQGGMLDDVRPGRELALESGIPSLADDAVLLELCGDNLREAILSGSVTAQFALGKAIADYLTAQEEGNKRATD